MTRVLLIPGSTRDGSLHTSALRTAAHLAPEGIAALLYGGLTGLPAFVPGDPGPPPVAELRRLIAEADALMFSTPQYAGSLPGSLKNLLDWLVDGGDLARKPAAWLSVVPPGQDDGACEALEAVLGHGDARLLKAACIRLPLEMSSVDGAGTVTDPRLHLALQDMLHALIGAMALPEPKQQPSWQVHSSVYPVIQAPSTPGFVSGQSAWPGVQTWKGNDG
ncbi:NADPH-dependent FMN reductase [Actinoplanes sp. NBRC 101535]|uniref:NADPH-dependent FMN reductase n=1 Tax=Actinoplanes sp. NBRC 101535 TaxID=3032196 RepID=UPI0024A5FE0B|nr:NADPH-dependent FMN reductase [Actinoplanes sp. NBRC 101535]GLY01293.1 hypothetical protein Acsp01_16720 [Actinoplanes sp. NBRC 101535]